MRSTEFSKGNDAGYIASGTPDAINSEDLDLSQSEEFFAKDRSIIQTDIAPYDPYGRTIFELDMA